MSRDESQSLSPQQPGVEAEVVAWRDCHMAGGAPSSIRDWGEPAGPGQSHATPGELSC